MIQSSNSIPNEGNKKLWNYPWKYTESFIIGIAILITGFFVEAISGGNGITLPGLPFNFYIICFFAAALVFFFINYKESPAIVWLSSIPAAISSVCIYAFLVLLLGFIPQAPENNSDFLHYLGLTHVKNSWPFILIQLYLLTTLGMVTIKRAIPLKKKNIGFLLNHFGLWLTLLSAGLGSADLSRLYLNLNEKQAANNIATDQNGQFHQLPFSLRLIDFDVDQYEPKIAIVDYETNQYVLKKGESLPFATKNKTIELSNWEITVKDLISQAIAINDSFVASESVGSNPAAFILAKNKITGHSIQSWITSGSFAADPKYLIINNKEALILLPPSPKKYYSKLIIYENKQTDTIILEVNKPHSVAGWKLYQSGYDNKKGKWSTLSIIEAVNDPWLPVVYIGIALLLAGSVYLFWIGKDKNERL